MTTMSEEYNPLVSVAVITYNSAKTVIETLESIHNQTYQNLELIISDDCSKDDTVSVCRDWVETHKDRFVRTEIITAPQNTGVTANYKRASENCRGEWIKEIDGDDLLLPDCLKIYMQYIKDHPESIYLFGKVEVFGTNLEKVNDFADRIFDNSFFFLPQEQQYEWLITRLSQPIASVTSFYNKEKVDKLGIVYDTRIPMLEDWPRWIQLAEKGVEFHFVDTVIAKYRVSGDVSICSGTVYTSSFMRSLALMYIYYQYIPAQKFLGKRKAWARYVECQKRVSESKLWSVLYALIQFLLLPKKMLKRMK